MASAKILALTINYGSSKQFWKEIRLNLETRQAGHRFLKWYVARVQKDLGQIFENCRTSATCISVPERLTVVLHTKKFVQYKLKHLFGDETCVAEI